MIFNIFLKIDLVTNLINFLQPTVRFFGMPLLGSSRSTNLDIPVFYEFILLRHVEVY
jgi:hypothetical protein